MSKRIKMMAAVLLVCTMVVCSFSFAAGAEDVTILLGDVDGSQSVTSSDARLILRHSVRLQTIADEYLTAADVNQDTNVTSADARLALRMAVNLEESSTIVVTTPDASTEPSETEPSETEPPTTEPPTTEPPATEPPATEPTAPVTTTEPSVVFLPDDSDPGSIDIGDLD